MKKEHLKKSETIDFELFNLLRDSYSSDESCMQAVREAKQARKYFDVHAEQSYDNFVKVHTRYVKN